MGDWRRAIASAGFVGLMALGLGSVVGCSGGGGEGPVTADTGACGDGFEATRVQGMVKPHVVRIVAGNGSGTGFIIKTPHSNEVLIATNHHVIAEADKLNALFFGEDGSKTELAGLEVVKVDAKNDLAILKATRLGGMKEGLYLDPGGAKLGARVAAMGYPYVKGSTDFALTFEPGDVSSTEREIGEGASKRKFLQTNANINPGNSGGPVVDACGLVVGVVVATHTETERVGLVVPIQHLVDLYKKYDAPKVEAQEGIKTLLGDFEKAVKWRDAEAAGKLFARTYLETTVVEDFKVFVERAETRESQYRQILADAGIDYDSAPYEKKAAFLKGELSPDEYLAWTIKNAIAYGAMGPYEAMQLYLSTWIVDVFGEVKSMKVIEVTETTDKVGKARVEIENAKGLSLHEFGMTYEWGDWRIATVRCARGC